DVESLARETGALQRRREIRSAIDLLRLVLAYTILDWSLRLVGSWASVLGLGNLSPVAVRQRLRKAVPYLGRLVGALLEQQNPHPPRYPVRVRMEDATTVSRPGSQGTDFRLHVKWDLGLFSLTSIEVTDAHGGETLQRHPVQRGEIVLADEGYAHRNGLGKLLAALVFFVIRINWQNLPLETAEGQRFNLIAWLQAQTRFPCEVSVGVVTPEGRWPVRLIAQALPPEKAEAARRRAHQASRKKGHTPRKETLFAAGYILLLTNLSAGLWTAEAVLGLYRLRWQIELLFKRLKGLLSLVGLRAKDSALAQAYLLGKIVGLLLIEGPSVELATGRLADWFQDERQPISLWRWTSLWADLLRQAIRGPLTASQVLAALPRLRRYLCDSPRKRRQEAALIRRLLLGCASPEEVAAGCRMLAYA
ncbi:MAG: transposase, partial [Anaerolineae bacterium]